MVRPAVDVVITRCFEGPRHERLYKIWEAIAEFCAPTIRFRTFKHNGRLSHAQSFAHIYDVERQRTDTDYLLLTEADFLPNLRLRTLDWTNRVHIAEHQAVATFYGTRDPVTKNVKFHRDKIGGWYILLCKPACPPRLDFHGTPDPCNQLHKDIRVRIREGKDGYPTHFGIDYDFGSHLFWSRHYNDHPLTCIGGFKLKEILEGVDKFVTTWIRRQPKAFRELLQQRFGHEILHSRHVSNTS